MNPDTGQSSSQTQRAAPPPASIRSVRLPDYLWEALGARAEANGRGRAEILRELITAYLATPEGAGMTPTQLSLIARPPDEIGRWEARAHDLIDQLAAAGTITPAAAGYCDALIQAGRFVDYAESPEGNAYARNQSMQAWDKALGRLAPPPNTGETAADQQNPWRRDTPDDDAPIIDNPYTTAGTP